MVILQMVVRMFKLVALAEVYSLAGLQELTIEALRNPTSQIPTPLFHNTIPPNASTRKTISANPSLTSLPPPKTITPYAGLLPTYFLPKHLLKQLNHIFHPLENLKSMTAKTLEEKRAKELCF